MTSAEITTSSNRADGSHGAGNPRRIPIRRRYVNALCSSFGIHHPTTRTQCDRVHDTRLSDAHRLASDRDHACATTCSAIPRRRQGHRATTGTRSHIDSQPRRVTRRQPRTVRPVGERRPCRRRVRHRARPVVHDCSGGPAEVVRRRRRAPPVLRGIDRLLAGRQTTRRQDIVVTVTRGLHAGDAVRGTLTKRQ